MSDAASPTELRAACHCGAHTVTVPRLPDHINHCQCTICRRYGTAWGYYRRDEGSFKHQVNAANPDAHIKQYIWGDRELSFIFCGTCGCIVYWWPVISSIEKWGLNMNLIDPELLKFVDRKFQYSILQTPLRDERTKHPDDPAVYKMAKAS